MLITPEVPKKEDIGNRHYRRMQAARQRALPQYRKKMKEYFTHQVQKREKNKLKNNEPLPSPTESN